MIHGMSEWIWNLEYSYMEYFLNVYYGYLLKEITFVIIFLNEQQRQQQNRNNNNNNILVTAQ